MKTIRFLVCGLAVLLAGSVRPAAAEHGLLLTVKRVASKSDMEHKKEIAPARQWKGADGTRWVGRPVEIDFVYASETIEVTVRNVGTSNETADLEYLFFKQDQGDKAELLARRDKTPLTLAAGQVRTLTLNSPVLKYSTDSVRVDGKTVRLGEKPYGYVVVLRDAGGVFKSAASTEYLRDSQDPKKLDQLLAKYPALPEPGRPMR